MSIGLPNALVQLQGSLGRGVTELQPEVDLRQAAFANQLVEPIGAAAFGTERSLRLHAGGVSCPRGQCV